MRKKPILFLVLGLFLLIVPTIIYLCFLVPQLSEEYNILMASGGVIGGSGLYGTSKISDKIKYSGWYKTSCSTFTILTVITLVEKFIMKLIFLVVCILLSLIAYKICKELYKKYRRIKENEQLAKTITQNIANCSK